MIRLIFILVSGSFLFPVHIQEIEIPKEYISPDAKIYKDAGKQFNIDWKMISAIHCSETMNRKTKSCTRSIRNVISSAGAKGCMQFMPNTWAKYGIGDINNCADSIMSAGHYLSKNYHKAVSEGYNNQDAKAHSIRMYNHADWYVDEAFKVMEVL